MNAFQRKVGLRVLVIHVGVIAFFMFVALLKGCFRPKPKPEMITYIEIGQPGPAVVVEEVSEQPDPEPEPEQPDPEPEPLPRPDPKPIPTPIPKPDPKSEPDPKPPKKKWTPTPVDPSKATRIKPETPPKPTLSKDDINRIGESTTPTPTPGPVGNPSEDAAYISRIGRFFDQRWSHPHSASPASSAVAKIYISKGGYIKSWSLVQKSGDATFDKSVKDTVNSVSKVPAPPAGFRFEYVEVEFRIRN